MSAHHKMPCGCPTIHTPGACLGRTCMPAHPGCSRCGAELLFSARQRGDGLCGPCSRAAADGFSAVVAGGPGAQWIEGGAEKVFEVESAIGKLRYEVLYNEPAQPTSDPMIWKSATRAPSVSLVPPESAVVESTTVAWRAPRAPAMSDPLDRLIDGVSLRQLLAEDTAARREASPAARMAVWRFTPAQRAAVSAHWSAELRARVAAREADRKLTVVIEQNE